VIKEAMQDAHYEMLDWEEEQDLDEEAGE